LWCILLITGGATISFLSVSQSNNSRFLDTEIDWLNLNRRVPQASLEELDHAKVIAIRHGQTDANVLSEREGAFEERTSKWLVDTVLTDAGVKKIEEIWPLARELEFEVIMVSPLRRAI